MKLKIYKAFHAYGTYLDLFYLKNQNVKSLPFKDQIFALKQDFFPWILSWEKYNVDADIDIFETIHNSYYLQQAWSNWKYKDDTDWQVNIILEQIRFYQPDICVLYPPELLKNDVIQKIRSIVKKPVLIGGYDGMNRKNISLYNGYDFIITCSDYISKFYKENNKEAFTLNFGFDKDVISNVTLKDKIYGIGFSGSIYPNVHKDRFELLSYLLHSIPITISSEFDYNTEYSLFSKRTIKNILKGTGNQYFRLMQFRKHNIGALYGLQMYQFLQDCGIVINQHGDSINFAANVRLFEATGIGSCLLTDWKENITDFFEPEEEIITYKTKEEALDKLKFFNSHPLCRQKIAEKGQKRTLSNYTYDKRIPALMSYLKNLA